MQLLMLEVTYAPKQNELKHTIVEPMQRKNERYVFKAQSNMDVLTELYGIIIPCHSLLHLTL